MNSWSEKIEGLFFIPLESLIYEIINKCLIVKKEKLWEKH